MFFRCSSDSLNSFLILFTSGRKVSENLGFIFPKFEDSDRLCNLTQTENNTFVTVKLRTLKKKHTTEVPNLNPTKHFTNHLIQRHQFLVVELCVSLTEMIPRLEIHTCFVKIPLVGVEISSRGYVGNSSRACGNCTRDVKIPLVFSHTCGLQTVNCSCGCGNYSCDLWKLKFGCCENFQGPKLFTLSHDWEFHSLATGIPLAHDWNSTRSRLEIHSLTSGFPVAVWFTVNVSKLYLP